MQAIKLFLLKYQIALVVLVMGMLSTMWLWERSERIGAEAEIARLVDKIAVMQTNYESLEKQYKSASTANQNIYKGVDEVRNDFNGISNELSDLLENGNTVTNTELPICNTIIKAVECAVDAYNAGTAITTPLPPKVATKPVEIELAWKAFEVAKKAGTP